MTKGIDVSIILRTRNEEYWVGRFAEGLKSQDTKLNVEIVLVDNGSDDQTIRKLQKAFDNLKLVSIEKYLPGDALNKGINVASGKYVVCISAHCVPASRKWLENLIKPLDLPDIAASYGRQVPLPTSDAKDKRDLWLTFGLDDKLQINDPFLHNANAAYRRIDLLERPFNAEMTNIEDRKWALDALQRGKKIYYTASAPIYHEHGIHQTGSATRLNGVIRMMDSLHEHIEQSQLYYGEQIELTNPTKILIVPVSDRYGDADIRNLAKISQKIRDIFKSWKIIFLPSSEKIDLAVRDLGFATLPNVNQKSYKLLTVLMNAVKELSKNGEFYDLVGTFDVRTFNVDSKFVNFAVQKLQETDSDTVIATEPILNPKFTSVGKNEYLIERSGWTEGLDSLENNITNFLKPSTLMICKMNILRTQNPLMTNFCTVEHVT